MFPFVTERLYRVTHYRAPRLPRRPHPDDIAQAGLLVLAILSQYLLMTGRGDLARDLDRVSARIVAEWGAGDE